ncbi:MAG TPA: DUF6504 family protein [Anaerolineales bacterium]
MSDFSPLAFVDEPVEVDFDRPPALLKKPGPPSAFRWRGEQHRIEELLSEWFDYGRKGRMARNMAPEHLETAKRRGSWGVGRFYFRVRVSSGRVFDLYYDRAPESAGDRTGHWFLWREMGPV